MLLCSSVENQVMRLPRYARGLRLVRIGMFLMLLHFALSAYLVTLMLRVSPGEEGRLFEWMQYTLWANCGAVGAMLLGTAISLPDFLAAKMSPVRLAISFLGFAVAFAALAWGSHRIGQFVELIDNPRVTFAELEEGLAKLDSLRLMTILRDLAYPVGVVALLRSIRQTAVANDHYALRDAASTVSSMTVGLAVLDVLYQLLFGSGGVATFLMMILGIVGGLALVGFWVYCHLRLAKFLKAAAILVYEPHNLPVAMVVVRDPDDGDDARPAAPSAPTRPSAARVARPRGSDAIVDLETVPASVPSSAPARGPSQPIIPVAAELRSVASQPVIPVAAELRTAPAPRADTAPGAPPDEPKLLR